MSNGHDIDRFVRDPILLRPRQVTRGTCISFRITPRNIFTAVKGNLCHE